MKPANIKPLHKSIIDLYYSNGFNGVQAVKELKPELTYSAAAGLSNMVLNKDSNKAYISAKQYELSKAAQITPVMIANELKAIATANITDLIGLSEAEIRQLNPATQRAIKKVSNRVKTFRNKDGSEINEVTTHYEMHDKLKALDYLSKYVGFYEAHNKQKAININLNKLDNLTLNNVLNLITENEPKHIE